MQECKIGCFFGRAGIGQSKQGCYYNLPEIFMLFIGQCFYVYAFCSVQ